MRALTAAMCVLGLLLAAPILLNAEFVAVNGRITDPQGKPVSNATIRLFDHRRFLWKTQSGPDGEFRLVAPREDIFIVKVNAPGFQTVSRKVPFTRAHPH